MATGFYTTIMREQGAGRKVGYIFGPFDDKPSARKKIPAARRLAAAIEPFTAFDLFGTVSVTTDGELPRGHFNAKLEERPL